VRIPFVNDHQVGVLERLVQIEPIEIDGLGFQPRKQRVET
jgi:hypothetical protein